MVAAVQDMHPEQLVALAQRVRASAKTHKREAQRHRLAAQRDMEEFHELERKCKEYGITLIIE